MTVLPKLDMLIIKFREIDDKWGKWFGNLRKKSTGFMDVSKMSQELNFLYNNCEKLIILLRDIELLL